MGVRAAEPVFQARDGMKNGFDERGTVSLAVLQVVKSASRSFHQSKCTALRQ